MTFFPQPASGDVPVWSGESRDSADIQREIGRRLTKFNFPNFAKRRSQGLSRNLKIGSSNSPKKFQNLPVRAVSENSENFLKKWTIVEMTTTTLEPLAHHSHPGQGGRP